MHIIFGLGNPGKGYENTRHNAGFMVLDSLATRYDARFRRGWRTKVRHCLVHAEAQELYLVKPQSFMNRSGEVVASVLRRKDCGLDNVIVVVDDVDIPLTRIRVRARGSAGGHNGLKSVIQAVGSENFTRVRVGIGRAEGAHDLRDFVLSDFSAEERLNAKEAFSRAADAVLAIVNEGVESAMNHFNG